VPAIAARAVGVQPVVVLEQAGEGAEVDHAERSAVGGSYRKRNQPLSGVGISYISRCRGGSLGLARPRKHLIGRGIVTAGMNPASQHDETSQTRGKRATGRTT
jgi:hypothetical protein